MSIRRADGTRWVLKMPSTCTVAELRQQIAEQLQIPEAFQKLADSSGAIMECSDQIYLH